MKTSGLMTAVRPTPLQNSPPSNKPPVQVEEQPEAVVAYRFGDIPLQHKLAIGAEDDPQEREAEAAAEHVLRMPGPGIVAKQPLSRTYSCDGRGGVCDSTARPAVHEALRSPGQPLDRATRAFMEPRFGVDFGSVRVHTGETAQRSSAALRADAFTIGGDVFFGANRWNPGTPGGRRLIAHELTHAIQQCEGVGPRIQRQAAAAPAHPFPWKGQITNTYSASLRRTPAKDPNNPHINTIADLPTGAAVLVLGATGAWMHVQAEVGGQTLTGYVSKELIAFVSESAFEVPPIVIDIKLPTVAQALVDLKRAQKKKVAQGAAFKPSEEEQSQIDLAIVVLNGTRKYTVNESTFEVDFVAQPGKTKIQITTIEDFILFVEQVEKQYPSATPQEVVSEIRQVWFSDENWEALVASRGIKDNGAEVDIETEPNPIATRFDMKQIAPAKGSLTLDTRLGKVNIGHVMAGIDAKLSGFPATLADAIRNVSDLADKALKYDTLKDATQGDNRDFTTWAGDLGQAYAEYLVDRYVAGNTAASLKTFAGEKTPPEQILGDIHGYIAVDVHSNIPESASPTGHEVKVSNILRDMYLVDKSRAGASTAQASFERESGKSGSALAAFVTERSLRFARIWFAKKAVEQRGGWLSQDGWTKSGILENALNEFDAKHSENEKNASQENKIKPVIDGFLRGLNAPVK
jgi:hypothetical protein